MKSRETLIRLKRFQVDEKRRQVTQLESMIAEFERMANELDTQVTVEQNRSGIHDVNHFAYPTFAKAAMTRATTCATPRSASRASSTTRAPRLRTPSRT